MNAIKPMLVPGVPVRRRHVDCAGVAHEFEHVPRELPDSGWTLTAVEINPPKQPGYEIQSKVASSIYTAYLDLLDKIRDAMARKHLHWSDDAAPEMLDGSIAGVIANDGLVVDGQLLEFAQLQTLLKTHEGFTIKISIGRFSE